MIGSPQQLGRDPVREARPVAQAPRQDRLQHRRARAAGDPRRARDHPQDRALPGALQARPDLPRRAARTGSATTAACTRRSCRSPPPPAGSRSINPNLQNIPIRTETGREIRACFIAEPGNVLLSRRLLARSSCACSPTSPTSRCCATSSCAARTSTPRPPRAVFELPPEQARRRHALEGQDGQLRDRLRPLRLRPRRPPADRAGGGAGVHRPLPRALPGRRAVHEGRRRRRPSSTAT